MVERFIQATVLGIADAVKDPQQATQLALQLDKELDPKSEAESMRRAIPLFVPGGSQPGLMNAKPWQLTAQVLQEQKILKQPIDVQLAFNLTFLAKIYGLPSK